jgi:hypothetical protein
MIGAPIAIYNGLDRLGHVTEESAGRWAAHNADGDTLGSFPDRAAATDAVIQATRAFLPNTTEGSL